MNKIYYPLNDNIGSVQLIQSVGDDASIINAARVSLGKQSDALSIPDDIIPLMHPEDAQFTEAQKNKDRKLIKYLLEHQHGTPFEHNSLTFLVKAPIFVARQWMRHRIASFNEISGRYVEVKEEFYIPEKFRKQSDSNRQASVDEFVQKWDDKAQYIRYSFDEKSKTPKFYSPLEAYKASLNLSFTIYQDLLKAGVCREQARGVLPLATYTEYYFTCNLRALLHFIKLRDHEGAQWEIQQYAKAMKEIVKEIFPETLRIWKELK